MRVVGLRRWWPSIVYARSLRSLWCGSGASASAPSIFQTLQLLYLIVSSPTSCNGVNMPTQEKKLHLLRQLLAVIVDLLLNLLVLRRLRVGRFFAAETHDAAQGHSPGQGLMARSKARVKRDQSRQRDLARWCSCTSLVARAANSLSCAEKHELWSAASVEGAG
jgi:hypothetical protein